MYKKTRSAQGSGSAGLSDMGSWGDREFEERQEEPHPYKSKQVLECDLQKFRYPDISTPILDNDVQWSDQKNPTDNISLFETIVNCIIAQILEKKTIIFWFWKKIKKFLEKSKKIFERTRNRWNFLLKAAI